MRGISRTIVFVIAAIVAMVGFAAVAARVVERGEEALAEARLGVVLTKADETIERGLQLGLPLSELQQVEPVLDRAIATSDDILAVDVFSQTGVTVFSTDRGAVGQPVPQAWTNAIAEHRNRLPWRASERETETIGTDATNDFGQTEGWVALILARDALTSPLSRLPPVLTKAWALILVGAAVMALVGTLILRGLRRPFERAEAALAQAIDGDPLDAHLKHRDALLASIAAAAVTTRRAEEAVADASGRLSRLDDEL
ncbi:MAG: hypothetical protein AAGD34_13630 [Pseudomonadota bacterium]